MKKTLVLMALFIACAGTGYADTLTGQIKDIDTAGNSLTLLSQRSDATEPAEHKVVWEDNLADAPKFESARAGQTIVLNAEQNPITRNWKALSIGSPIAAAEEKLLRTDDRTLNGEIRALDIAGNSLVLVSKETDAAGQPVEYKVVWEDSNVAVRDSLEKASIGDKLTFTADQNMVTRNWRVKSLAGPIEAMVQGGVQVLSGQVKSIDAAKNSLVLNTTDEAGKAIERKVVWDEDFQQQAKLENAKVGEMLKVHADQNMLTRNWKVKAIA